MKTYISYNYLLLVFKGKEMDTPLLRGQPDVPAKEAHFSIRAAKSAFVAVLF